MRRFICQSPCSAFCLVSITILLSACPAGPNRSDPSGYSNRLWISVSELQSHPMQEKEIAQLRKWSKLTAPPRLFRRNEDADVRLLAATYLSYMERDSGQRAFLRENCLAAIGSEAGVIDGQGDGESLALARNLPALLIACHLLEMHKNPAFRSWVQQLDDAVLGRQKRSLRSTHEERANNWGTHAGAARASRAVFLNDRKALADVAHIFAQWTGEQVEPSSLRFQRDRSWQADSERPLGINPKGAERNGKSIDGVLPDDQRRGGPFQWPPPHEPYVWEALQGAVVTAQILHNNGYPAWEWGDRALLRAVQWLIEVADFWPTGDDIWILPLIDLNYGTSYAATVPQTPLKPGKNMGFTSLTHAGSDAGSE